MLVGAQVLEVPVPEGVEASEEELDLLRAVLGAIVGLRYERGLTWEAVRQQLRDEGWSVGARLVWCAEARRGQDHERAQGATRDEAFAELYRMTRFDGLPEGLP